MRWSAKDINMLKVIKNLSVTNNTNKRDVNIITIYVTFINSGDTNNNILVFINEHQKSIYNLQHQYKTCYSAYVGGEKYESKSKRFKDLTFNHNNTSGTKEKKLRDSKTGQSFYGEGKYNTWVAHKDHISDCCNNI